MTFDFRIQIVHIRPLECNLHVKWGQFAINILNKSCFNGGLSKNHHFLCDFQTRSTQYTFDLCYINLLMTERNVLWGTDL